MDPARPLLDIQEIDTATDRLSARMRALETGEDAAAALAEANEAERMMGELRLRLDELSRDQMRFEHEIDSMSQKAAAEERRLYDGSVANARELDSITHEVDNLKKRRSDREDELLALMEVREELEGQERAAAERSEALRARVAEVGSVAADDLERLRAELKERTEARTALAQTVEPEFLELYEDLRPQKKGVAAVALIDGVCQGCHEQLSSVYVDRLKRVEGPKRCEHCRRILVI
ncbi:MAG: zinc ribbon domain-containing protein [Actinomycetota bacterium]